MTAQKPFSGTLIQRIGAALLVIGGFSIFFIPLRERILRIERQQERLIDQSVRREDLLEIKVLLENIRTWQTEHIKEGH